MSEVFLSFEHFLGAFYVQDTVTGSRDRSSMKHGIDILLKKDYR